MGEGNPGSFVSGCSTGHPWAARRADGDRAAAGVQGQHPCYGRFKNFFSFRLSPAVSGGVYTAYLVYILTLIPKAFDYKNDAVENVQTPPSLPSPRPGALRWREFFYLLSC